MRFLLLLVPLLVVVRSEGDCCDGCDCDNEYEESWDAEPEDFIYEVREIRRSEFSMSRLFQKTYTVLRDLTSQLIQGDGPYLRAVSELDLSYISDDLDFDFGFIGGAIVATGLVLSKPFILAFF